MRTALLYSICFFLLSGCLSAQIRVVKPKKIHPKRTNLSIGAGITRSELFMSRNVKENNRAKGYSWCLIYGGSKIFRTSLEYIYYRPINIEPTWFNIQASTIEANVHVIARFKETKAFFYPIFGLSYNHFSGYFTGRNDFMGLSQRYGINSTVVTNWVGFNVGTGFEQYIKKASVFIDYKMRVGYNDGNGGQLNIMDICLGFGVRYTFRVPSIYSIVSGTKNRYFLETE